MATLHDVARRAGVSIATASRVATRSGIVRAETRERVERAMRELLYVPRQRREPPSALAASVTSGAIGLLLPELANPIFPALAQAMEERATTAGLASILCNTSGSIKREVDYVHMLLERRVDGMIFISSEISNLRVDHSHYRRLQEEGARIVFVNGPPETRDSPVVGVDQRLAGQMATEHLIALGHRRIAFAAGPSHYSATRERMRGWEHTLRAVGVAPDGLLSHGDFSVEGGRAAAHALLRADAGRPTGVICSSDLIAIGVLKEAGAMGIVVPRDLSIVGYDGIEAVDWTEPPLTTITQQIDEIASCAVQALLTRIAEPERHLPHYLFPPTLRVAESTAPPAED